MHKLDRFFIDRLDALTTRLQKRGILLTSVHVHVAGATLALNTAQCIDPLNSYSWFTLPFNATFWGGVLYFKNRWADKNKDYPYSKRIMERLNARALLDREIMTPARYIWWGLTIVLLSYDITSIISGDSIFGRICNGVGVMAATTLCYLESCFFIGPGEFAKNKQEKLSGKLVVDNVTQ